jgi:hypothetical protein
MKSIKAETAAATATPTLPATSLTIAIAQSCYTGPRETLLVKEYQGV